MNSAVRPIFNEKVVESGICGSVNSARMHCLLWKSQYLRLLFNEQCMNSSRIIPKCVKKKNAENANVNAKAKSKPSLILRQSLSLTGSEWEENTT